MTEPTTPGATTETLTTTPDGRPLLRFERRLAHPVERVWAALTDLEQLSVWYPFRATAAELRVGGRLHFVDQHGTTYTGVITELEEGRVLAFREDDAEDVRWELRPDGEGCLLVFTATVEGRPPAGDAAGWHLCFEALGDLLTGREVDHVWTRPDSLEQPVVVELVRHYETALTAPGA